MANSCILIAKLSKMQMGTESNCILFLLGEAHSISPFCLNNTTPHLHWNTDMNTQSIDLLYCFLQWQFLCALHQLLCRLLAVEMPLWVFEVPRNEIQHTPSLGVEFVSIFLPQTTLSLLPNDKILIHIKLHCNTSLCCANDTSFINENVIISYYQSGTSPSSKSDSFHSLSLSNEQEY